MASIKFTKILSAAANANVFKKSVQSANQWYRQATKTFRRQVMRPNMIESDNDPESAPALKRQLVGNMYYFSYLPKHKDTLPYYDAFPLVLPLDLHGDGFTGINFHYLPPMYRAILFDRILDMFEAPSDRLRVLNRSRISYNVLESMGSRYKYFKPAVKRYLFKNIRSRLIELDQPEWKVALFLPVQRFIGADESQIYRESRKQIRGK